MPQKKSSKKFLKTHAISPPEIWISEGVEKLLPQLNLEN